MSDDEQDDGAIEQPCPNIACDKGIATYFGELRICLRCSGEGVVYVE